MSLASLIHNKPIDSNIAFLGSLDLYGRINKVSKLREKVITAYNNNITQLFIPIDNKIDEPTLPIEILKEINIMYISSFEEIYKIIFKK